MGFLHRLSFSQQLLVGLFGGLLTGLFFGELAEPLAILGSIFVRLLQMAVLPYVLFSLVGSVGKLSSGNVRGLLKVGGSLLLGSWALALAFVALNPLAFPEWESASFFSDALVAEDRSLDFIALYLPTNPFHALANNIVPSVVVFSLAVGGALIHVPNKERMTDVLDVATSALSRVTSSVARFMPIAIFAVTASAAGTMSLDDLSRLQVYFVLYLFACAVLTFGVLPLVLSMSTPLKYGSVFRVCTDALVTGFTTASLLVTLPMMIEGCKRLLREEGLESEEADAAIDVLLPVTLNVPLMGKLLTLAFVPFAGWFVGSPIEISQVPRFLLSGLVTYFGSVNAAIPFLLDSYRIPADMFQLFLVTGVVSARFSTLLTVFNMIAIGVLGALVLSKRTRVTLRSLLGLLGLFVAGTAIVLIGSKILFAQTFSVEYEKGTTLRDMTLRGGMVEWRIEPLSAEGHASSSAGPVDIASIRSRGRLRVGFTKGNFPYAYVNDEDTLVGFDVELAHRLAEEIGVALSFVSLENEQFGEALRSGGVDVVLAGLPMSTLASSQFDLTRPYLEGTLGLIVLDHDRARFKSMAEIAQMQGVRIAVVENQRLQRRIERLLPRAKVKAIDSPEAFFEDDAQRFDALLFVAEAGAAWTLLHPAFTVVVPQPVKERMPIVMAVGPGNAELRAFLDEWIDLARALGVVDRAYDYWVLGRDARPKEPRWSILRALRGKASGSDPGDSKQARAPGSAPSAR